MHKKGIPSAGPFPHIFGGKRNTFILTEYGATWNREMPAAVTERLILIIEFYVKVGVRHKLRTSNRLQG